MNILDLALFRAIVRYHDATSHPWQTWADYRRELLHAKGAIVGLELVARERAGARLPYAARVSDRGHVLAYRSRGANA